MKHTNKDVDVRDETTSHTNGSSRNSGGVRTFFNGKMVDVINGAPDRLSDRQDINSLTPEELNDSEKRFDGARTESTASKKAHTDGRADSKHKGKYDATKDTRNLAGRDSRYHTIHNSRGTEKGINVNGQRYTDNTKRDEIAADQGLGFQNQYASNRSDARNEYGVDTSGNRYTSEARSEEVRGDLTAKVEPSSETVKIDDKPITSDNKKSKVIRK